MSKKSFIECSIQHDADIDERIDKVKSEKAKGKVTVQKAKEICYGSVMEDIKHRAYRLALKAIKFIDSLNQKDATVQIIAKQLLRSITSIGANIIEAQSGSSKKDFTNMYNHGLKSANESKFWICLLRDSDKAQKEAANDLLKETTEISNILAACILTLKGKRKNATVHSL